jgi:DNA polymerase
MTQDQIRDYLRFYRDLGFEEIYRRETAPAPSAPAPAAPAPAQRDMPDVALSLFSQAGPSGETLDQIRADLGDCTRCRLHQGRTNLVFGVGNPQAKIVFVGEGPGADEDAQGIPFVGRAGQLLTQMIENTAAREGIALKRADVYICNVVKCRPPENRTPEKDEMETCSPFLFRQIESIRPKAICVLGATAAKALLATSTGITQLRGKWHEWRGIPVMATYHPAFLLRGYNQTYKKEAWEDLKRLFHFVYG